MGLYLSFKLYRVNSFTVEFKSAAYDQFHIHSHFYSSPRQTKCMINQQHLHICKNGLNVTENNEVQAQTPFFLKAAFEWGCIISCDGEKVNVLFIS